MNALDKEPLSFQQQFDHILINKVCSGDQTSFETLVSRYHSDLFNFVRAHTQSYEQAEDIVQEIFLKLYISLPKLQQHLSYVNTAKPLRAWLFQVARNRCIDEGRRKHPLYFSEISTFAVDAGETAGESSIWENIIDPEPLPEEAIEQHDIQSALYAAIKKLPTKFCAIVSLRYKEELSFNEIGQRLHMPENTVRTYFQRARPLLRTSLAQLTECA